MRTPATFASILVVSLLGAFALEQIRRHGRGRWWTAIPFVVSFIVLIYLMALPGPFLWGIIE